MPHPSKRPAQAHARPAGSDLARLATQSQLDFELEFFGAILERDPANVDVLRAHAANLAQKGRHADSLRADQRWVALCPADPLAHYNLACSFAITRQVDSALASLRQAVECGYRDFRHIREDRDLDGIRKDPRFRQLLKDYDTA